MNEQTIVILERAAKELAAVWYEPAGKGAKLAVEGLLEAVSSANPEVDPFDNDEANADAGEVTQVQQTPPASTPPGKAAPLGGKPKVSAPLGGKVTAPPQLGGKANAAPLQRNMQPPTSENANG